MDDEIMGQSMVIYLITNTVNGKKYVGQTARPLGQRIREHKCSQYPIGNAIRQHGWKKFTVEILDECKTPEELNEREIYRIATLQTKTPNGYNLTDGGEEQPHESKAVICLDNGMLFTSIADAARWANISTPGISHVCNGKALSAGGYRWAFADNPVEPKTTDGRKDREGRAVRNVETGEEFESINAAARHYNVSASRIASACKNIEYTAANHHWQWADEALLDPSTVPPIRPKGRRPVRLIETGIVYQSISEAASDIGVSPSSIHCACTGNCKTIKGFHFEFVDPKSRISTESRKSTVQKNSVPVLCIETGISYVSISEAAKHIGVRASYICAVCNGREKTAGGYHWRRLDREHVG